MNILYVTSEAVPFCKTGGLADVAGSLPQSLAANGDRVSVILPLYQSVADAWRDRLHFERYTYVRLAWRSLYCGLFSYEWQGVTWYFVDNEQYFKRPELYGYYDDGERFAFFCRAVTAYLLLGEKRLGDLELEAVFSKVLADLNGLRRGVCFLVEDENTQRAALRRLRPEAELIFSRAELVELVGNDPRNA